MIERWEAEHFPTIEPGSADRHRVSIKSLMPFFGEMPIGKVTPQTIEEYRVQRRKAVMPATYNREFDALKCAFGYAARKWRWLASNPMQGLKKERENNFVTRWLSEHEEKALTEQAPGWLKDIILFLIHTGLRREECLSLTWDRVDLDNRVIHILKVTRTKNTRPRTVPLNNTVMAVIQRIAAKRKRGAKYLFAPDTATRYDGPNVGRAFRMVLDKSGIAHCRIHDLRHTFASRLVQKGVDIHSVAKLLRSRRSGMCIFRWTACG